MRAQEMQRARESFGMSRNDFAILIGYTGEPRNNWKQIQRYENGEREIPPTLARLVRLLVWYFEERGIVPDFNVAEDVG